MLKLTSTNVFKLFFAGIICVTKAQIKNEMATSRCPNETFYSRDYKMCVPCSTCDDYSTMFTACTETSDTVCVKCADTAQEDLADHPACLQCPPCQPGQYMEAACTSNTPTVCRPCPVGSFNALASYRTHCIPCTSCENQIMIRDCNSSIDTECGACQRGYFRDPHRNRCNRCLKCYPGQVPIKECESGQSGKRCSEYIITRTDYIDVPNTATVDATTTLTSVLTSTQKKSTFSSTEVFLYSSTITAFDITIIVLVILLTLILCALIILLKCKLKLLTKTSNLLDDNDDNSAMYIDDNVSHTDEIQFFQNLAESQFTNNFENQQCFTDCSFETESPEFTKTPSENSRKFGNAYNFIKDSESSKPGRESHLYLSTNTAEVYRIHGVSRHERGQNSR
ncbi:hypothetical protein BsWGS_17723 [Bradybaena similaris]